MIAGHIDCLEQACPEFPKAIFAALQTLAAMNFETLEDGVLATPLADMKFSLFHAETESAALKKPETHIKNVDIHYLVSGEEALGYQAFSPALKVTERLVDADNVFYENHPDCQSMTVLSPGGFAVYFPWDVHMPLCAPGTPSKVRKVVVKVPVRLL
jgi:biofilm protein TabA